MSSFKFALWTALAATSVTGISAQSFAHFEARQTHPIRLSPDGTRLFALNTPDQSLSVFDISSAENPEPILIAEIPVGMEPASLGVRHADEVWVVNEVGDSISIVSVSRQLVIETLRAADEPADIVFAQGKAFVSCARNNTVRVFDAATRQETAVIPLNGLNPRALASNADGTRIFAAFQLSGNRTTILPASLAPNPPAPTNPQLPAAPKTALIVSASDPRISHTVLDHDVAEIDAATQQVIAYHSGVGTNLFDLAMRPGSSELWIANTEALNLVRFEPNLKGHFVDSRLSRLSLPGGAVSVFDMNPGINYAVLPNAAAQATALAQPAALAFYPDGSHAWIAAFLSDRVAKVAADGTVLARVDVRTAPAGGGPNDSRKMRGPRGLALHPSHPRLYILNKLSNSITVVDTEAATVLAEVPAGSHEPTPAAIKEGRGFVFDARLSGNGTVSCASCHLDADRDGLAWDLGDPGGALQTVIGANLAVHDTTPQNRVMHPMKGPMTTQTLRGFTGGQIFHWRGDKATLQDFNPTFQNLLGGTQLPAADADAMAAYLMTLRHHPNPNRNLDRTLPASFNGANPVTGRDLFNNHNASHCITCHALPTGSDNNIDDLRLINSTQPIKTPPLRTVYQRAIYDSRAGRVNLSGFGLNHDGTGSTHAFPMVHFYELDNLSGTNFADVTAFLHSFDTGTAPTVGFSRTVTPGNASAPAVAAELQTLESQAAVAGTCDLVVRGRKSGALRRYFYDKAAGRYLPAQSSAASLSRSELLAGLQDGDALTFLGVLPGDGPRLGGDRDADGTLDLDEPLPALTPAATPGGIKLTWPEKGWVLESTSDLATAWHTVATPRQRSATETWIEEPTPAPSRYYRLRRTW